MLSVYLFFLVCVLCSHVCLVKYATFVETAKTNDINVLIFGR
jgi:hypothetical protein